MVADFHKEEFLSGSGEGERVGGTFLTVTDGRQGTNEHDEGSG